MRQTAEVATDEQLRARLSAGRRRRAPPRSPTQAFAGRWREIASRARAARLTLVSRPAAAGLRVVARRDPAARASATGVGRYTGRAAACAGRAPRRASARPSCSAHGVHLARTRPACEPRCPPGSPPRAGARPPGCCRRRGARAELPPMPMLGVRADVVHGTNFVLPPPGRGAAGVVTVHDLSYLRLPETVSAASARYRRARAAVAAPGGARAHPDPGHGRGARRRVPAPRRPRPRHPARGRPGLVRPPAAPPAGPARPARALPAVRRHRSSRARTSPPCSRPTGGCARAAIRTPAAGAGRPAGLGPRPRHRRARPRATSCQLGYLDSAAASAGRGRARPRCASRRCTRASACRRSKRSPRVHRWWRPTSRRSREVCRWAGPGVTPRRRRATRTRLPTPSGSLAHPAGAGRRGAGRRHARAFTWRRTAALTAAGLSRRHRPSRCAAKVPGRSITRLPPTGPEQAEADPPPGSIPRSRGRNEEGRQALTGPKEPYMHLSLRNARRATATAMAASVAVVGLLELGMHAAVRPATKSSPAPSRAPTADRRRPASASMSSTPPVTRSNLGGGNVGYSAIQRLNHCVPTNGAAAPQTCWDGTTAKKPATTGR